MSSKSARKRRQREDAVRPGPAGSYAFDAVLSRVGVFPYQTVEGTVWELRPVDEVLSHDSWETLKGAPVTVLHPSGEVDPNNWKRVTVGMVGDDVRIDGELVRGTIRIYDKETIDKINSGALIELSPGYEATLVDEIGIYRGQEYQKLQTEIRYNHVALLPAGTNRQGPTVALKFDGRVSRQDTGIPIKDAMDDIESRVADLMGKLEESIWSRVEHRMAEMFAANGNPAQDAPDVDPNADPEAPVEDADPEEEAIEIPPQEEQPKEEPMKEEKRTPEAQGETIPEESVTPEPKKEEKKYDAAEVNAILSDVRLLEKVTGKEVSAENLSEQLKTVAIEKGCSKQDGSDDHYRGYLSSLEIPKKSLFVDAKVDPPKSEKKKTAFDGFNAAFENARKR